MRLGASIKVQRSNAGGARRFFQAIAALRGEPTGVKVGFPAGKASGEIIERAVYNEFGTRHIPERPFLRNAMRANRTKYVDGMKSEVRQIIADAIKGRTRARAIESALNRLGIIAVGDIQDEITALSSPPNAASTIRQKGSSNPLIDTGAMRAAVTHQIVRGGLGGILRSLRGSTSLRL